MKNGREGNSLGLLPLTVSLIAYIGTGPGTGNSDNMPLMVGVAIASGAALLLSKRDKKTPFEKKTTSYCKGGKEETLILMVLIFLLAGTFGGVARGMGAADSIINMGLTILPENLILPEILLIGYLLSFSMGTPIRAAVVLTPITVDISSKTGINACLLAGVVVGGTMFGDDLSFTSDTTIAATRTQGISMEGKFKVNVLMILPAVVINVILLVIQSGGDMSLGNIGPFNSINIIPYILVITLSLVGLNITVVMIIGISSGVVIGCFSGDFTLIQLLAIIRNGAIGMEDMALIAVMVGGMTELMKHFGGINFLMNQLTKGAKLSRGDELSITTLVSLLDIATTNNIISIIVVGSITRDIADNFHTSRLCVTDILDLFSSAFNGLLPYAGQLLVTGDLANAPPTAIMGYNWYSMLMIIFGIVFIIIRSPKSRDIRTEKEQVEKEVWKNIRWKCI